MDMNDAAVEVYRHIISYTSSDHADRSYGRDLLLSLLYFLYGILRIFAGGSYHL